MTFLFQQQKMKSRTFRVTAAVSLSFSLAALGQTPAQPGQVAPPRGGPTLSLQDAEAMALKNHPQILNAEELSQAANQAVVETKAPYYPAVSGEVTGSYGNNNARIGAGALAASRIFNRFAQGVVVSQLITDSGRTPNLVASSRLQAQSAEQNAVTSRYDVLLGVNQAYYDVLRNEALVRVAEQTVAARQLLVDQVTALARNGLRSQVDVGFADVNLSEAKLLLIRSQDGLQAAYAQLGRALGNSQPANYTLVDQPLPPGPPATAEDLVAQALQNRPEIKSLELSSQSAYKFEQAEHDLVYPTVSLVGVGGAIPLIDQITAPRLIPNEYAGAAVNVNIPVFNGHLFSARRQEAHYRALAADQRLRDERERVARDVRTAWGSSMTAYQRMDVTAQLMRQATLALNLAQGRYNLGLGSIVELTQAQLNLTQAEIENLTAKYDYQSLYAGLQYTMGLLR